VWTARPTANRTANVRLPSGRAGNTGTAIGLVNESNRAILRDLRDLLRENNQVIPGWFEDMVSSSHFGSSGYVCVCARTHVRLGRVVQWRWWRWVAVFQLESRAGRFPRQTRAFSGVEQRGRSHAARFP
jgi:hypothetical protein